MNARTATLVLVAVGVALRACHFAGASAFWMDEVAIARAILEPDLATLLTQPLRYEQVAPKGFVLVQKLASWTLGSGDHALRLLPFLASVASMVAFRALALRILCGAGAVIATALFAFAAALISFGATLKQYSSDVCSTVLLFWIALDLASEPPTRWRVVRAALAGAVIVWFSQPAMLVAAGLGAALALLPRLVLADPSRWRALAPVWLTWAASTLASVAAALSGVPAAMRSHQDLFWEKGYPPVPFDSLLDLFWTTGRITKLFGQSHSSSLGYPLPSLFVALSLLGFVALWLRNRRAAVLALAPVLAANAAAWARMYPFSDRLILYLVPIFLLTLAAGIDWLRERADAAVPWLGTALAAGLTLLAIGPVLLRPPPYGREDVVPAIRYLVQHRQPGDSIYVFYGAAPTTTYYGARFGLARDEYEVGGCHRGHTERYYHELDAFRGRPRVWILLTHASRHYERQDVLGYLDAIGTRKDAFWSRSRLVGGAPSPAQAILYDLSDAERLRAANADSFPQSGVRKGEKHIPCGQGPLTLGQPWMEAKR